MRWLSRASSRPRRLVRLSRRSPRGRSRSGSCCGWAGCQLPPGRWHERPPCWAKPTFDSLPPSPRSVQGRPPQGPTSWPAPGSWRRVGRCASCTRSYGPRLRRTSHPASGLACTRRRRAPWRTRVRLQTASRPTCWRPIPPGTIGSSIHCRRPPRRRSPTALPTRPARICGGRWPSPRPSPFVPISCASLALPSPTRMIRRRRPISRPHSRPQRRQALRSRSRSNWEPCSRSMAAPARP